MKKIKLTQGCYAKVDDEDYIILSKLNWFVSVCMGKKYASSIIDGKAVLMHRFIINPSKHIDIDHKNGNGLDNRKINLRVCSHAENMRNRKLNKNNKSGFKGVSRKGNKYFSCIQLNNKTINLGLYDNAIDAAEAYDKSAIEFFGEFARTNKDLCLLN